MVLFRSQSDKKILLFVIILQLASFHNFRILQVKAIYNDEFSNNDLNLNQSFSNETQSPTISPTLHTESPTAPTDINTIDDYSAADTDDTDAVDKKEEENEPKLEEEENAEIEREAGLGILELIPPEYRLPVAGASGILAFLFCFCCICCRKRCCSSSSGPRYKTMDLNDQDVGSSRGKKKGKTTGGFNNEFKHSKHSLRRRHESDSMDLEVEMTSQGLDSGVSSRGLESLGEEARIKFSPTPVVNAEIFERAWGGSEQIDDVWGCTLRSYTEAEIISEFKGINIHCLASGMIKNVSKFYFYAIDESSHMYMCELTITSNTLRAACLFKQKQKSNREYSNHQSLFVNIVKGTLSSRFC